MGNTHVTQQQPAPLPRLREQNRTLHQQLISLKAEAGHNEDVLRRFHERELLLLTAENLPQLLDRLTAGLRGAFGLDAIGLTLEDPAHELRHLLAHAGSAAEHHPGVHFADALQDTNPRLARLERCWLGEHQEPEHRGLLGDASGVRSVALLPLRLGARLAGILTLGSRDPTRYTRHHGTDFLEHLASIAAVCLENVTNRERLVLTGLTDALTGLHNRRYLENRMGEEVARAGRYRQPLSCLFLDLDHFKRINDSHGHQAGDDVLRTVALRTRGMLRTSDVAVRYGGEEFAILLPQTGEQEACRLAERIREALAGEDIAVAGGETLRVTVSVGVSEILPGPDHGAPEDLATRLIAEADAALYRAKDGGRNRVVYARA